LRRTSKEAATTYFKTFAWKESKIMKIIVRIAILAFILEYFDYEEGTLDTATCSVIDNANEDFIVLAKDEGNV
jgi:hypothetical protein